MDSAQPRVRYWAAGAKEVRAAADWPLPDSAQFDMQVPPYYSRNTLHYGPDSYLEVRVANSSAKTG